MGFLSIFFFVTILPTAAAGAYCQDAAQLSQSVQDCSDNKVFANAALACVEKFEAEAKASSVELKKRKPGRSASQRSQFQESQLKLGVSLAAVDELIKKADLAFENIYDYAFHNVLPEDADLPFVTGPDPEKWAMGEPCFAESRRAIEDGLDIMENYKEDLVEARKILLRLKKISQREEAQMKGVGSSLANPKALPSANGKISAPPRAPGGDRESDVTGYERILKQKGQKPKTP